jgi:hypothetical protein
MADDMGKLPTTGPGKARPVMVTRVWTRDGQYMSGTCPSAEQARDQGPWPGLPLVTGGRNVLCLECD